MALAVAASSSASSASDSETGGVDQAGMKRLLQLVGDDPSLFDGTEDTTFDGAEESDGDVDGEASSSDSQDDGVLLETLDADVEDVNIKQKLAVNNAVRGQKNFIDVTTVSNTVQEALDRILDTFKLEIPFLETQTLTCPTPLNIADATNDLERELEFYKQSLWAANHARKLFNAAQKPFHRPNDYFAEMVKSDEHMERVRQRLLDESASIKASEDARRQRHLKKFGKQVQVAKQQERERARKEMGERLKEFKKKRKSDGPRATGGDDDFDVELDDEPTAKRPRQGPVGGRGKAGRSRQGRDAKYGRPQTSRRPKENTRESTSDHSVRRGKGRTSFGKGQARGGRQKQRPGKSRRAAGRRQ